MNIKKLGTDYGGWSVDVDSIPDNSTIIDAGLGEDISFCKELLKIKKVNIVGIDPTEKAAKYINKNPLNNFNYIKKAITKDSKQIKMFTNIIPGHVSESFCGGHKSVGDKFYIAKGISIKQLRDKYDDVSLIKLDIEGAEYSVYDQCFGVKQVCIEFHHHCIDGIDIDNTKKIIKQFENRGYNVIANKGNKEITFLC